MNYRQQKRCRETNLKKVSPSAVLETAARIPIAVEYEDKAQRHIHKANVAEGCGSRLPAIMRADSTQDKDAVIISHKEKETIVFLGPGGYKIRWSPGTHRLPMEQSPSGHLVIPCDKWKKVATGRVHEESTNIFWTHTTPTSVDPGNSEPEVGSMQSE